MLGTIVNKGAISNRVRFMIQDVIDLRNNNWNHCRRDNNPKTFELFLQKTDPRQDQERENINPRDLQGSMASISGQDIRRIQGGRRGGNHNYGKRIASRKWLFIILIYLFIFSFTLRIMFTNMII